MADWRDRVCWPVTPATRRQLPVWQWSFHHGAYLVLVPARPEDRPVFVQAVYYARDEAHERGSLEEICAWRVRVLETGEVETIPNEIVLRYVAHTDIERRTFPAAWLFETKPPVRETKRAAGETAKERVERCLAGGETRQLELITCAHGYFYGNCPVECGPGDEVSDGAWLRAGRKAGA